MQILILPSEQLWDGWHTLRSLLRTRAPSEAGILRHNRNSRNQRDRNLKKIFTKRNRNWGFCLFNKSLQGTCFNWIATSTAKQIKICKTFSQPFQGVKPVIWLKAKPGLSAQVWRNYALLLSHWGISLELIIFHRSWRSNNIFASCSWIRNSFTFFVIYDSFSHSF